MTQPVPFTLKSPNDEDEDDELVQAWVVDIPDPRHIPTVLKCLGDSTATHLKRIRRQGERATLLLAIAPSPPPPLPPSLALGPAYQIPVPNNPARTSASLALKNAYWPTVLCPRRKWEPEPWSDAQVEWATQAVGRLQRAYAERARDELPIVAHVPVPFADPKQLARPFFAYDTRSSTHHPLRHAALDMIRQIADHRADAEDGGRYLLTGLSLFITHEPCVMCTMALLHSRVKHVFYLVPMSRTGGCGGITCVPALKGVNHRFTIAVWDPREIDWLEPLQPEVDV